MAGCGPATGVFLRRRCRRGGRGCRRRYAPGVGVFNAVVRLSVGSPMKVCRILPSAFLALALSATLAAGCRGGPQRPEMSEQAPASPKARIIQRNWEVPEALPGAEALGRGLRKRLKAALDRREAGYKPRTHHLRSDGSPVYTKRLILESSPYLLQHAHNPVNWYPWGDDAFETARRLGRPVLLSVGYSTCHWCHVMERESFEDEEIAAFINAHYIAIKVDREERPDIDSVYMEAVRMLTRGGGWPMTVVATPDREPFFGGTYFPPRDGDRGSSTGFLTILERLSERYRSDPESVVEQARRITERIQALGERAMGGELPGAAVLHQAFADLSRGFDSVYGGFGRAPKFPRSVTLGMLMRYYRRTGEEQALHMAVYTLERMAAGGIYDHVGGGFHRYSTDSRWLVPHFEKMLYDNAQLASTYLEAYQISGREQFAQVAREVLDYVAAEMTGPEGGFHSATDADSPTPSGRDEEGWFFTWTKRELEEVLGSDLAVLVEKSYGVTERGNFEGRNILNRPRPLSRVARELKLEESEVVSELEVARAALYQARSKRPPPGKDDKVLASWNGLMMSAFARGGRVLGERRYTAIAEKAAGFILSRMRDRRGRLLRSFKDGSARFDGLLDDYAFVAAGLLDLFEADFDLRWLKAAIELHEVLASEFWDAADGGFFISAADSEKLLVREKPSYDGAEPSGNAVALSNLLRLYELTTEESYREMAEKGLAAFAMAMERSPTAVPRMLSTLDFHLDNAKEIIIVKPDEGADASPFLEALASTYLPNCVLVVTSAAETHGEIAGVVPLVEGKAARGGKVTAYVCEKRVCKLPTSSPQVFTEQIRRTLPYP